ncbi:MAG: class I SAM-dependent methyltransferase [Solirubrobacteraceae bacterium]
MASRDYHEALWDGVPVDAEPQWFHLRRAYLLDHVAPGDRVLDVGCGEGRFTMALSEAGAIATGIDVAEEPLRRARRRHAAGEFTLVPSDGPWPFEDGLFDTVWAGEVIEHVADTGGWLSELRRVLHSGGRVLLSTPNHDRLALLGLALAPRRFAAHFDPRADHLRFYNRASLRDLLTDHGFRAISIRGAGGAPAMRPVLLASALRARW